MTDKCKRCGVLKTEDNCRKTIPLGYWHPYCNKCRILIAKSKRPERIRPQDKPKGTDVDMTLFNKLW